jgi:ABC-type polysaccharide/polyol phosphate transport system ATPase subunit
LDKRLTLRDNVYFSCSLLGMSRREISRKFGSIVDFAELGGFEDVKLFKFSDGMIARLAFSIAIHQDFDILLVDETIAVGDASFVQKCENKIFEFKRAEKTIIYVSQSLDIGLCDRIVWMDKGRMMAIGGKEVIKKYWRDSIKDIKMGKAQLRLFREWIRELEKKDGK